MNEKRILMMVNSPFIIKLYETYNGSQSIYFLMEAALGGELFATYNRKNLFGSTPHAQFYVGGAICAIEYLHSRRIVYRPPVPRRGSSGFLAWDRRRSPDVGPQRRSNLVGR